MPVVFKDTKREPLVIDKDGSKFFFDLPESKRRQIQINRYVSGDRDPGAFAIDTFRCALVGWENVTDQNGNDVPFSIPVRDSLVEDPAIFTDDDVLTVLGLWDDHKKKDTTSTSKNA